MTARAEMGRITMLAALLAGGLAGCSSLNPLGPSTKAPTIYDILAPGDFAAPTRTARVQLLVPPPTASDALATARIAVRERGQLLAYLPGAVWSDDLPSLLQTTLTRGFENSGRVQAVGLPGQNLAIDAQLIVDIRAFELDVTGKPAGHVALGVKLLDDRTGRVRASRVFDQSVPAASDRPADAVTAVEAATRQVTRDIVAWAAGAL